DLADCCGANRQIAVAREITKIFEEFRTGTPGELAVYYGSEVPKGEVTVLVAGTTGREAVMAPEAVLAQARELIADGMSRRDAASHIASSMGLPKNDVYSLVSRI
ncbi:MAG: 16S rRNA (cytidine(1402)-2'-O)-methyltransferase, partial [Gemmatimonadetes bacterium]|nr:16S rRNA (cytidine(1402)-2'-O)-methyltransferase [Gemmatimonadota bacterium]